MMILGDWEIKLESLDNFDRSGSKDCIKFSSHALK